ncbi:FAD-dependent oxidoreductase [Desulfotomaculum copahuensis]|uniref:BzdV protein n=1 Tax=Desulfotomaculum copahuensis TaxID=1838280 RepID=A0A1B7LGQ1_9FIRM|nr:FAD-dependent oxidoreductase [Desulfotomaculum copahuensis]OAT85276.1 hypothetical protein A6M21_06975 [Desulfotomaculum copahuensis]
MSTINLTIDGTPVAVTPGTTLLAAAGQAGVYIPALCAHPDLPPAGVCGLCAVEIEGRPELAAACETTAEAGMVVLTGTARVREHRREKLAAILARHPHACLTCAQQEGCSRTQCSSNVPENERCCPLLGRCELQKIALYVGIKAGTPRYVPADLPVYTEHPLFTRDYNLCTGCGRCVRMCRDVRGVGALQLVELAGGGQIAASVEADLAASGCRFCTACVEVCPTGALRDKDVKSGDREAFLVPCRNSCPAGIDVPRYVNLVARGEFAAAGAVIREKVPFPAVLGRVCFHPCEDNCRRGRIDQPVSICRLKRFAADEEQGQRREQPVPAAPSGKRVAVVGAGPAGLTAAWYLARKGHAVTVFDALPVPGGMLAAGIPAYRLPRDVLQREIEAIAGSGVEIKTGVRVDDAAALLAGGYGAVLVATGAHREARLGLPGEDAAGVYSGLAFLRRVNLGEAVSVGDRVVVTGGGNVALDAARTARRLGAREVHVYYRRTEAEMPAFAAEVQAARDEGVIFHFRTLINDILTDDGRLTGVRVAAVASLFDGNGRYNPVFVPGSEEEVPCATLLVAVGQRPAPPLPAAVGNGRLQVDARTMATDLPGIFAAGDAVGGPASVIEAIAGGRWAAAAIDRRLGGDGVIDEILVPPEAPDPFLGKDEDFLRRPRHGLLARLWTGESCCSAFPCPPEEALTAKFFEVELGLDEEMALTEASRCLRCDLRLQITPVPLPPEQWLPFNAENLAAVPETEGVYQLLDEQKNVIAITGTATLRSSLAEQLAAGSKARFFDYEEEPMYTQRESQLIQQFLQEHGHLPAGNDELDDLF